MGERSAEDIERELALRAHDRDSASQDQMFGTVIDYGLAALKSAALICGGSVVVGLAFAGAVYESEPDIARSLFIAIILFAAGAASCGVASGFSYLSQSRYAEAAFEKTYKWDHPYVVPNEPAHGKLRAKGDFWRSQAIRMVVVSYIAIFAGIAAFGYALR